jgi:hypothetical protein
MDRQSAPKPPTKATMARRWGGLLPADDRASDQVHDASDDQGRDDELAHPVITQTTTTRNSNGTYVIRYNTVLSS